MPPLKLKMSGEKNRCSGYSRLSVSNRWIYINISRLTKSVGAMAASFVRALQATDKFVDQISGLSTVAKVEAARIKVLCNLVEKLAPWKAEDASAACAAINAAQALKMVSKRLLLEHFTDKLALEEAMEEEKADGGFTKAGSKLQNYTNLALFLPSDLWAALLEPQRPSSDCLMLLCHHAHQLGLLHPCERTCAAITCLGFWNVWRHGIALHTKQHTVEIAKVTIKSYLQHYERQNPMKQCHMLKRLPKRVADLPPGLKSLFDKNPPGVADDDALRHSQSMPCRRSHTAAGLSAVGAAAAVALDTKGKLAPATSLRVDALSLAMLPADMEEASEERNGSESGEAEKHDDCEQLVLVEPSKAAHAGIAALKPSKRRDGGGKEDVKYTLDDLKAKLNARRGATEKSAPADKKTNKAKATAKSKKVEKAKSKVSHQKPIKEEAKMAEKPDIDPKAKEAKGRGKGLTAKQKKSKPKAKGPKSKGLKKPMLELSQEEISAIIARVSLPKWFSCKKVLLQKFPEDTEKRFTSRCYHRVKDFELEAGKSEADAKSLARAMHKHAKEMWNSMFEAESLST